MRDSDWSKVVSSMVAERIFVLGLVLAAITLAAPPARAQNQPPILARIPDVTGPEARPLSFLASAVDPEGDPIVLSSGGVPPGAQFVALGGGSARFDWIPSYADAGVYVITVIASDGSSTSSTTVNIHVIEGNRPPSCQAVRPIDVAVGTPISLQLVATDPDGLAALRYTTPNLPTGSVLDETSGLFQWTPGILDVGTHLIVFGAGETKVPDPGLCWFNVSITVHPRACTASIDPVSPKRVVEGEWLDFFILLAGAGDDGYAVRALGLPDGSQFESSSGEFSWTPAYDQAGTYTLTFIATSEFCAPAEPVNVEITVLNKNRAPEIQSLSPVDVVEGSEVRLFVDASDPDGDGLEYAARSLPRGATLSPTTGELRWVTSTGDAGTYIVSITVTDDAAPVRESASTILQLRVEPSVTKETPVIQEQDSADDKEAGGCTCDTARSRSILHPILMMGIGLPLLAFAAKKESRSQRRDQRRTSSRAP